jgi:hypothetical protein
MIYIENTMIRTENSESYLGNMGLRRCSAIILGFGRAQRVDGGWHVILFAGRLALGRESPSVGQSPQLVAL